MGVRNRSAGLSQCEARGSEWREGGFVAILVLAYTLRMPLRLGVRPFGYLNSEPFRHPDEISK